MQMASVALIDTLFKFEAAANLPLRAVANPFITTASANLKLSPLIVDSKGPRENAGQRALEFDLVGNVGRKGGVKTVPLLWIGVEGVVAGAAVKHDGQVVLGQPIHEGLEVQGRDGCVNGKVGLF